MESDGEIGGEFQRKPVHRQFAGDPFVIYTTEKYIFYSGTGCVCVVEAVVHVKNDQAIAVFVQRLAWFRLGRVDQPKLKTNIFNVT